MRRKVLIVDDSAFMRVTLKNILINEGYDVIGEAKDARDGIEKYKELAPDLVTMDITLPNLNGIEAVKNIIRFDKDAKIIMCSAMGQEQMIVEAFQAGAKEFLIKPFNKKKVIKTVNKIFNMDNNCDLFSKKRSNYKF